MAPAPPPCGAPFPRGYFCTGGGGVFIVGGCVLLVPPPRGDVHVTCGGGGVDGHARPRHPPATAGRAPRVGTRHLP